MKTISETITNELKSILGRTTRLEGRQIFRGHESQMSFKQIREYALDGIAHDMARIISNDMVTEQYSINVSERDYPNHPGSTEISGAAYIMRAEDYTTICRIVTTLASFVEPLNLDD